MGSILTSIKLMLGIPEEYEHFDSVIIMHINSVFSILTQLGVGSKDGFFITGKNDVWSDFIQDETNLELIKSYIFHKVKLMFDPPLGSTVMEATNRIISELEWRINTIVDPKNINDEEDL